MSVIIPTSYLLKSIKEEASDRDCLDVSARQSSVLVFDNCLELILIFKINPMIHGVACKIDATGCRIDTAGY